MPKPIDHESRYNPAIDGVRTLAVIGVILYHMRYTGTPGGLLGVAVFFTISGFLITGNLMRSWNAHRNLGLKTFWLRRFRRLMPAVIVTVISVWIIGLLLSPQKWASYQTDGLTSIFYVNNWASILHADSYFDQFSLEPFDHMWSLSVEEQFYLAWPLILLALLWITRGKQYVTAIITLILAAASFVWMAAAFHNGFDTTRIYEGTDTRAGGLLVGAALAIILSASSLRESASNSTSKDAYTDTQKDPHSPSIFMHILWNTAGLIGLGIIIYMYAQVGDGSPFLYLGGIALLSAATALLLWSLTSKRSLVYYLFAFKPLAWIGERSYAIYLWHMPIIAFLKDALTIFPLWLTYVTVCTLSTLLAALSWTFIEDPIRRNGFFKPIYSWIRQHRMHPRWISGIPVLLVTAIFSIAGPAMVHADYQEYKVAEQIKAREAAQVKAEKEAKAQEEQRRKAEEAFVPTQTRCRHIIHLGDSTSMGMFNDASVPTPEDNARVTYTKAGAQQVTNSSFGARATNAALNEDPTGNESIQELLAQGVDPDTCWVIALGVNDAANMNVAGVDRADSSIKATMDLIGPNYPVLWITAVVNPLGSPQWYTPEIMNTWNEGLYRALDTYPNMWVYPWDKDVVPEWFITGDGVHFNSEGNYQRSHRFAQATINAWPLTLDGYDAPLLPTKSIPSNERIVSGQTAQ